MSREATFGESREMRIRAATMEDVLALNALIERSVRGLGTREYTAGQIEGALGHALGLDTQLVVDGTYFVVEDAGRIAGAGGWSWRATLFGSDHGPGREAAALDPATDAARIRAIFVDPEWARQGIGGMILAHCEEAARAAGFRRFEMGSTLSGFPLYRLKGYKEIERVGVPLPNGETLEVVRMVKEAGTLC